MIDRTSHYEYLATHVDATLIWSKDPLAGIESLEKIYLLKNVCMSEYYFGAMWSSLEIHGRTKA
jgi:hypothetical protein